jgi:hypothetical protein
MIYVIPNIKKLNYINISQFFNIEIITAMFIAITHPVMTK